MDQLTSPAELDPVQAALALDDAALDARWAALKAWLDRRFGRDTSLEGALFLVGVQARGAGFTPGLAREEKQDVIMEGTYLAFEALGLYRAVETEEGRRWERVHLVPPLPVPRQEKLLRAALVAYFDREVGAAVFDPSAPAA